MNKKYYDPAMLAVLADNKDVMDGLVNDGEISESDAVAAKFRRFMARQPGVGGTVNKRYVVLQAEMDAIAAEKGVKI